MKVMYETPDVKFINFDMDGRIMDDIFAEPDEWFEEEEQSSMPAPILGE